jgi:hypothetical protein
MNGKTHLGSSILAAVQREQTTQFAIAQRCGISHANLTRMIVHGQRPEPGTLRQICAAFDRPDGARVLCGHLCDEIERAGFLHREIDVHPRDDIAGEPDEIERNADRLAIVARKRKDVRELLAALAIVVEALEETDAPLMLNERVAEIPDVANVYYPSTRKTPKKQKKNGQNGATKNK